MRDFLLVALILWLPAGFALGVVIGRAVKARDKQVPR